MNATTLETPLWNSSDSTDARPIILTFLDWTRDKDPRVPLAMASLMAALREAEVPAKALSFPVNDQRFERQQVFQTLSRLLAAHPGTALGFGVYVWSEASIQHLGRRLRWRFPHRPFVLGGPQISYSNSGLEKRYPFGSAFIRGYGEDALVRVLTSSLGTSIPGVQWAGQGLNPSDSTASVNLEKLPSPFLDGSIDLDGQQFIRWETQRGCAFNCSFCQHREAGRKLTDRNLNHGRLKEEIRLFAASSVSDIAVLDPIFNSNASTSNHIAILKEFRRQGFGGKLSLQCRFEFVTEEFLQQVKHLNCTLEFGLQTIHRQEGKAVRRPNNMDMVDRTVDRLHSLGIHFEISLIFGLPRQTLDSFQQSVSYCLERSVPVIKAFPLMLLRGTQLEREADKWGLLESDDAIPRVIASDSFGEPDWHRMAALSEALSATENHHPDSLSELQTHARSLEPDIRRWTPQ